MLSKAHVLIHEYSMVQAMQLARWHDGSKSSAISDASFARAGLPGGSGSQPRKARKGCWLILVPKPRCYDEILSDSFRCVDPGRIR